MVIHGHIENGIVVPHGQISLPDGTEVVITVCDHERREGDVMPQELRHKYLAALAAIDAVANENPGDTFSGADHDSALYR